MKKNAFTLIEVIAVVTILAIMVVVSMPSFSKISKNTKEKQYQQFLDTLYIASENYIFTNDELTNQLKTNKTLSITINDLMTNGYLKTDTINPKTEELVYTTSVITVTMDENNKVSYHFSE